jgi:hypothetical protein
MKTLTIHAFPEHWGHNATDRQAEDWAITMRNHAEAAGFRYIATLHSGTTDACELFQYGKPANETDLGEEIDWFARWCSHEFRGMTAWLKKQIV